MISKSNSSKAYSTVPEFPKFDSLEIFTLEILILIFLSGCYTFIHFNSGPLKRQQECSDQELYLALWGDSALTHCQSDCLLPASHSAAEASVHFPSYCRFHSAGAEGFLLYLLSVDSGQLLENGEKLSGPKLTSWTVWNLRVFWRNTVRKSSMELCSVPRVLNCILVVFINKVLCYRCLVDCVS